MVNGRLRTTDLDVCDVAAHGAGAVGHKAGLRRLVGWFKTVTEYVAPGGNRRGKRESQAPIPGNLERIAAIILQGQPGSDQPGNRTADGEPLTAIDLERW